MEKGQDELRLALQQRHNMGVARNVILFLGDGMGVSTVTAARIYKGQKDGHPGEETQLNFEKFPYAAFSKVTRIIISHAPPPPPLPAQYKRISLLTQWAGLA